MRTTSVYAATCHHCGATLESETTTVKCRCGVLLVLEWGAVTEISGKEAKAWDGLR